MSLIPTFVMAELIIKYHPPQANGACERTS